MKLLPKNILEIKADMKISNILVFVAAFISVTVGLIFLNSIYANIFKFNFSPVAMSDSLSAASTISKNDPGIEMNKQLSKKAESIQEKDSIKAKDDVVNLAKDSAVTPPPKAKLIPQVIPVSNKPADKEDETKTEAEQKNSRQSVLNQSVPVNENEMVINNSGTASIVDTIYQKWIKQTAKLYESMDPKKAALIIKKYSESTARDIIYKMKKNKAADVLSELDPATANRIAQFPGDNEKPSISKN
ncbi:MAG: hypothetical protein WAM24_02150 [Ignavibacteriaceae bacterium]